MVTMYPMPKGGILLQNRIRKIEALIKLEYSDPLRQRTQAEMHERAERLRLLNEELETLKK